MTEAEFAPALYEHHNVDAARHLFEVAASFDSQVIGETEILAQARDAYRAAAEASALGPVLRKVFDRAFFLAKELRGAGGLVCVGASISTAAVQLAAKIFEDLREHKVLILGAGEMAEGIAKTLKAAHVAEVLVASRTLAHAERLAGSIGAKCCRYDDLAELLPQADIVLVSTSAPHHILRPEHIERAAPLRHGRPLFIIDISVPRNVDPAVHGLRDTFVYDIDDLEEIAREGRRQREEIAERWRPRLDHEAQTLLNTLTEVSAHESARLLLRKADELRAAEMAELRAAVADNPALAAQVERSFERFQNRLLHAPLSVLKQSAREGDGASAAHWFSRLFHLHKQAPTPPAEKTPEAEKAKE